MKGRHEGSSHSRSPGQLAAVILHKRPRCLEPDGHEFKSCFPRG